MQVLDLNNLEIEQVKRLNEISKSIKCDFNNFTEKILENTDKSLVWLLHPLVSRNPYQSDLFLNVCYTLLSKERIDDDSSLEKIITNNKAQYDILKTYLKSKRMIKLTYTKNHKPTFFVLIKSLSKILYRTLLYVKSKDKNRTDDIKKQNNVILLDTFILENSLKNGKYIDRYYPGLLTYLNNDEKSRLFWIPSILGSIKNKQLSNIWKNSKENIIYKHDLLKITDYLSALYNLIKLFLKEQSNYKFYGIDISKLVVNEYKRKRFHKSTYEGILNYYFIKRLKENKIDLKSVIDWNENQPIDKGLIKGVREFFPNVYIKGYQGYIISTDFNFYIQPTDYEVENSVIPDEICVVGKGLVNRIKNFSDNIKVSVAPAFRFNNVYKQYTPNKAKQKYILVALPIGINESFDIINLLSKTIKNSGEINHKINIKLHPSLNLERLKNKCGENWLNEFNIIEGDFNEIVINSDLLIGSTSTTLVEALSRGIPVIVIGSQNGITQNPIPEEVQEDIWTICYTAEALNSAINHYLSDSSFKKVNYEEIGKQIKTQFFKPVNKQGVYKLLF